MVRRAISLSTVCSFSPVRRMSTLVDAALALLLGLFGATRPAGAQTTFTCSGGGGSNCALTVGASQSTASTSSFTVPTAGTIQSISIKLDGVWSNGNTGFSMGAAEFLLTGPGGSFDLLGETGDTVDGDDNQDAGSGLHGLNIVIQDGANPAPMACGDLCSGNETNNWPAGNGSSVGNAGTITDTVKPGSYFGYDPTNQSNPPILGVLGDWPDTDGCNPDPIIGNGGSYNNATNCSSPTLTSKYGSTTANGTWTLTVQNVSGVTTAISITDWSLTITYASATPTATSISSNANPSNASNTVTFTATVTSSGGTPTGTVTFTDNSTAIAGCSGKALSSGQVTCSATLGQGNNDVEASYTPSGNFGASNATMNQLVEVTATQSGNTWCNTGGISAPGNSPGVQYPSVIHVPNTAYNGATVSDVTVELKGATGPAGVNSYHLLVAPNGQNLDFFDSTFSFNQPGSPVDLTIEDGGSVPSGSSPPSTGTYEPYDGNGNGIALDAFPASTSPSVDSNIPQVPGTINRAAPLGGTSLKTFEGAFSNAPADGDWALYVYAGGGESESINNGWCITFDVNTGVGTTTTLASSQNPQATGQSVTLTATVVEQGGNTPVTSGGTVTFLDNGQAPAGVASNTVTLNGSGQASVTTSSLIEGDHVITATYSGTATDNGSFTTMTQRMNDATQLYASGASIPNGGTCSATYCYCNPGAVSTNASFRGAFTPDPSNISVANLPGTIGSVTLGLNQYSSAANVLYALESMVVGPTGADLDFFSNAGWNGGLGGTASLGNYIFSDAGSAQVSQTVTTLSPGIYRPSSYVQGDPNYPEPAQPYFASSSTFYTLPSTITYAAARGSGTLSSQFADTDPNGVWSLYMSEIDAAGSASAAHGWCVNFTLNPIAVTVNESHNGSGTSGDFIQSETGAQIITTIANNGSGPTGDPTAGSNPLKVVDTLNAAFTYASFSGTNWSCSAASQIVTCTNDSAVASGSSYPTLTLNVNVASGAPASISNSVAVSGAGVTSTTSNTDTIAVLGAATLAIGKSHTGTFTQGSTGVWTLVVSNTAATGSTSGTVTVSDTLPTGYTLSSSTSTGSLFGCSGTSTVTCTGTPGIAAGGSDTITLTVNIPADSPTSVSNTASTWGGGDSVHNSSGTAAASNTDTVSVIATTTTTAANATATFNASNQSVTLSATVTSGAGTVNSGTVTFTVMQGATQIGSATAPANVSNGSATATYTLPGGTGAGTYTIVANYTGAGGFPSSSDNTHTLTVNAAGTTTTASTQSATYSVSSQAVTLSATVTSAAGTVNAGTVTFTVLNGGIQVGTSTTSGTVTGGNATVSYTLPANTTGGTYTIQAIYSGSTDFTSSTDNTHTLTVTGGSTTTSASSATAAYNSNSQPVTLNATVTSAGGTVNSGTITFTVMQGATQIGSAAGPVSVSNGNATALYTLPAGTNAGTYTVVASYTGAGGFVSSTDNTHTLTVNSAATTTASSNQTALFSTSSQNVTLSASVTSAAGTVNAGTVTFIVLNGGTPVGTPTTSGTVTGGNASVNYVLPAGTPAGAYTIQAIYNGSTNFTGSVDNTHLLTVSAASSVTTASNAAATYNAGSSQSVTLSATVVSPDGIVNEGTLTFTVLNGGTPVGVAVSGPVAGGTASASFTLPAGTAIGGYTIQATYADLAGNFTPSSDNTHILTVNPIQTFVVLNTNDSGSGSLRAALANSATAGGGNIVFAPGAFGSGATILLQSGLTMPGNTTITGLTSGSGASLTNLVTVDGASGSNGSFSVFTVNSGTTGAAISNLIIAHGTGFVAAPNIFGGGILNSGVLTVTNSTFSGNSIGSAGLGGAIYNDSAATLMLTGCTFANNSTGANGAGGAILNGHTLAVTNSTFFGNSAGSGGEGGAILNAGTMTLSSDTFSGNTVGAGGFGGAVFDAQIMTVTNSILSQDGDECVGNACPTSSLGGNLIDPTGTQTLLAPLGNYGGPTQTMIPRPGSLAICAGSATAVANAGLNTDQRGTALALNTSNAGTYTGEGGYCSAGFLDMGAVQTGYSIAFAQQPPAIVVTGAAISPSPTVQLSESGIPIGLSGNGISLTASLGTLSGTATQATNGSGLATFGSLSIAPTESNDQLTANLILNSNLPGPNIAVSAVSSPFNVGQATPTLSFTPNPASQTYGTAITAGSLDGTATYNSANVAGTFTYTTTVNGNPATLAAGTTVLPAGNYTITAAFAPSDTATYKSASTTASYMVNPAALTITASSGSMTYGGTVPAITPSYSGFVNGDSSASLTTQPACSTAATSHSTVGSYTSSCSGAVDANYAITYTAGSISVGTATLSITASSGTMTYGGTVPTITASYSGFVNGDSSASLTTQPACLTTATSHSAVGNYTSSCSGAVDANYTIGYTAGSVTVGQAVLTIAASNATKTYGTANPAFSGMVTGAVNGDTFTESFSTMAVLSSPVGAYFIVPSATGTDLSDYTQTIVDGTLNVTQAGSVTSVGLSSTSITPGQSETITVTVASSTMGTPTGSASIYDGTTLLATVPLVSGVASYTTAALAPGLTHVIGAVYSGDTNFTGSTSTTSTSVTVAPLDFTMTIAGPSSATVVPGQSVTYQVTVTPLYGSYAGTVNFTVTGLPPGASVTFSPSTIAANGGPQTITVTISAPPATASNHAPSPTRRAAPLALAFLLLFGLGAVRRRTRAMRRLFAIVLLLAGGAAATLVSGCGGASGFFAQTPQNYNVTITATSTNLQHSVGVTLNVE